jgi:hypothetical protein
MDGIVTRELPPAASNQAEPKDGLCEAPERLTLRLSPEARKTLEWIALRREVSFGEVIRRALGTEKFLIETADKNGKVLLDIPGDRMKELVII